MKPLYWIFILFCQSALGQLYWSDSFQNVNNLTNGSWLGDTSSFKITNDQKLQLDANGGGSSRLYKPSSIGYKSSWNFYISMEFNPSSANNARINLAKNGNECLFVAFGEGGRDLIELGFSKNQKDSIWAFSTADFLDSAIVQGVFQLFQDSTGDYSAFWLNLNGNATFLFSVQGPKAIPSKYFEISCKYTSTRADKFLFDDISVAGYPFVDLSQPSLLKLELVNNILKFTFSKPVENKKTVFWSDSSIATSNHSSFSIYHEVNTCLPNKMCTLNLKYWNDSSGQSVDSTITFESHETLDNSLFISEIMHDPTPSRGLPEINFIELYCNDDLYWNKGFLVINNDTCALPPFQFEKGKTYLLSSEPSQAIENKFSINKNPFQLPKENGVINLYDESGVLIAYQEYRKNSHHSLGAQGGYSLERTNFSKPICPPYQLKTTSSASGGSPGTVWVNDAQELNNQGGTLKYLEGEFLFFRTPNYLKPLQIKASLKISGTLIPIQYNPLNRREFYIKMPIISDTLLLNQPLVSHENDTFPRKWYIEIPREKGHLEISEVMYDCEEKGEFIEISNGENYSVYLGSLWLGQFENNIFYQEYKPFLKNWIIPAKAQLAMVENEGFHRMTKSSIGNLVEIKNWKSLVNSGASLGLNLTEISNSFAYGSQYHSNWIEETKNISLGREQTFNGKIVSQAKVTLGLKNSLPEFSQDQGYITTDKNVIQSKAIPMKIKVSSPQKCMANLELISLSGEKFYTFFENHWLQSELIISYFGENKTGGKLIPGPYILKLTVITPDGKIKNQLKKIAIAP